MTLLAHPHYPQITRVRGITGNVEMSPFLNFHGRVEIGELIKNQFFDRFTHNQALSINDHSTHSFVLIFAFYVNRETSCLINQVLLLFKNIHGFQSLCIFFIPLLFEIKSRDFCCDVLEYLIHESTSIVQLVFSKVQSCSFHIRIKCQCIIKI